MEGIERVEVRQISSPPRRTRNKVERRWMRLKGAFSATQGNEDLPEGKARRNSLIPCIEQKAGYVTMFFMFLTIIKSGYF